MQLFPHQQKALDLTAGKNRVAYYLDMGLGKTFVGGEKANSYPERIVLVCQKSKIDDWISHFKEHYPLTVFDLTNKKQLEEFTGTIGKCVGVINYDLVFRRSYFAHISGFTLVLDESSIIQNETAKRSKFILKMQPENVILLSGTPTAGIHCYILDGNVLIPDLTVEEQDCAYVMNNGKPLNWAKIPLIPLKYNEQEIPLIKKVKSLQDGINVMLSDFENNMQEDARNTILVLKNYDGTNLGEFRKNLATFGAVKVRYDGETKGGVETLEITVNAENYKVILEIFKKALIENAMGYDAKDDRLSGNPNQMNIQSMYSDIDLDANDMETEFQAAFEEILWFVNAHLANTGRGNFENEEVTIIFNRDILINESEAIANCAASVGIISDETIIGMHPWIDDPQQELDRLKKQKEEEQAEIERQQEQAYNPFGQQPGNQPPKGKGGDVNEE